MGLLRKITRILKDNLYSRIFLTLGLLALVGAPIFIYSRYIDIFEEIQLFEKKELNGNVITETYEVNFRPGKGSYRKFRIYGQDYPAYPILLTNHADEQMIEKGALISKAANSRHFKIASSGKETDFELDDQKTHMKVTLTIVLTMIIGWTILMTFLGTLKKFGKGNDAQQKLNTIAGNDMNDESNH